MIQVLYTDISKLPSGAYELLYAKSTPDRRTRADRYLRREDGLRCLVAGALLEYALGCRDYSVSQKENGKPFLSERPDFHFNLSHSGDWVAIAWGRTEVGLDVEEIPRDDARAALARRFFTPEEQAYVFEHDDGIARRFTEIWTKKESYLKYLGTGLGKSLNSFNVLSPEVSGLFHGHPLAGGYCLSLCTMEESWYFQNLDAALLLSAI